MHKPGVEFFHLINILTKLWFIHYTISIIRNLDTKSLLVVVEIDAVPRALWFADEQLLGLQTEH